jgi:hypothetical protein
VKKSNDSSDRPSDEQSQPRDKGSNPARKQPRPEQLRLRTDIGKVVGGVEAAQRFQVLLAKTLRLQDDH